MHVRWPDVPYVKCKAWWDVQWPGEAVDIKRFRRQRSVDAQTVTVARYMVYNKEGVGELVRSTQRTREGVQMARLGLVTVSIAAVPVERQWQRPRWQAAPRRRARTSLATSVVNELLSIAALTSCGLCSSSAGPRAFSCAQGCRGVGGGHPSR